jgi:phytoene dehydrogenase-like protein
VSGLHDSVEGRDAIVIGAGPNGLAAAIVLAQAGRRVVVLEAAETIGGGCRTAELTLPGFRHDPCSAIHPLAKASPFFQTLPLASYGLEWVEPPLALAHPFDDGTAAILSRSVDQTAASLGEDAAAYVRLMEPLIRDYDRLVPQLLGPLRLPKHPLSLARFGLPGLRSARGLTNSRFKGERARGLFAGLAAHSFLRLEQPVSAAFGLTLGLFGHAVGWPIARGGSQAIVNALAAHLRSLGGELRTNCPVRSLDEIGNEQVVLFDVTPRQFLQIAGDRAPAGYRKPLKRYRYGPGVFKMDWALDGPVPWSAPECHLAGTLHLGGTFDEISASEENTARGRHPERPFVLIAQQSRFDGTRAPAGKETLWGYCHVPNCSREDMTERIERQIERFAPGFRERIIARSAMGTAEMERYNENYVGGEINGGLQDLRQLFTRPAPRLDPYSTPNHRLFICSSSTPPGGGVHGMAGYFAAQSALRKGWNNR